MKKLFALLVLATTVAFADTQTTSVRDNFNRAANLDLSTSVSPLKWKKITDAGNTDQTWQINADSSISAYDPTPSGTPGIIEIYYDSLFNVGSSMIGIDLKSRTGIYDGNNTGLGLGMIDTALKASNIGIRAVWYPPTLTNVEFWELEFISASNGGGVSNHIGTSTISGKTYTVGTTAWLISKANNVWTLRVNWADGTADSISETYQVGTRTTLRPVLISKFITGYPEFDNFRVGLITTPPPPSTDQVAPTVALAQVSPTVIDSTISTDVTFRICDTCSGVAVKAKLDSCYAYVDSASNHLITKVFKIWNQVDTTFTMGARFYHPGSYTYYVKRLRDSTGNVSDPAMSAKNFVSNVISSGGTGNTTTGLKTVVYYPSWAMCLMQAQDLDWNAFNYFIFFLGQANPNVSPYFTIYAGSQDSLLFETGVNGSSNSQCLNSTGRTHQQVIKDSALAHGVRLVLGISAETGTPATNFAAVIADPTKRTVMAHHLTGFAKRHGYSGIDINWEYVTRSAQGRLDFTAFCDTLVADMSTWSPKGTLSFATADWYWWNVNGNSGALSGVGVLNGGSGYTSAPAVGFSGGGSGAAAHATISGGRVASIIIDNPGSGYFYSGSNGKYPTTVTFTGGGGTGAKAVITSGGEPLVDMAMANRDFDWVFLEGYGLQGSTVGAYDPVYFNSSINGAFWDDDHLGMREWVAAGLNRSRVCAAMAFECLQRSSANGNVGTAASGATWIGYKDIPQAVKDNAIYDPVSRGSWGWSGGTLYLFNTQQAINEKVSYAQQNEFGYVGAWELYRAYESTNKNRVLDMLKTAVGSSGTVINVPNPPSLNAPSNGTTGVTFNGTSFNWHPSAGATQYRITVALDPSFTPPLVSDQTKPGGVNDTTAVIPTLNGSTTYYWHVAAGNASGYSNWGSTFSFTTAPKIVATPSVPVLNTPANAATGVSITPTLSWFTVYIDSTAVPPVVATYDIQISSNSSFTSLLFQSTGYGPISYPVSSPLSYSTTYYWRVRSKNGTDSSAYSAGRSFTTVTAPIITGPPPNTVNFQYKYGSGQVQKYGVPDYVTRHVKDPTQVPTPPAGDINDFGTGYKDEFNVSTYYNQGHVYRADSASIADSVRFLKATGVAQGTYTNATVTVGPDGRIFGIASGSSGGGASILASSFDDSLNVQRDAITKLFTFNKGTHGLTDSGRVVFNDSGAQGGGYEMQYNGTKQYDFQIGNGYVIGTIYGNSKLQWQNNVSAGFTEFDGGKFSWYNSEHLQGLGIIPIVDTVNWSGVAATIAARNFDSTRVSGFYDVDYYIVTTTTGTGTTAALSITWNDGAAAQTFTTSNIDLTTLGSFQQGSVRCYNGNAANLQWSVSGTIGTSKYGVKLAAHKRW